MIHRFCHSDIFPVFRGNTYHWEAHFNVTLRCRLSTPLRREGAVPSSSLEAADLVESDRGRVSGCWEFRPPYSVAIFKRFQIAVFGLKSFYPTD